MSRSSTVEHWYERNHVRNPAAVTARRQALRQAGLPYSRRAVRHGRQKAPGRGEVLLIIGLSLLAIPLCMAIEIYR